MHTYDSAVTVWQERSMLAALRCWLLGLGLGEVNCSQP
jgi:hypothetical protein